MEEIEEHLEKKGLRAVYGREAAAKLFTKVWFRKGQLLLVPGQTAQSLYFISSGLVRGYLRNEGYETTLWFVHGGHFLLPDGCFSGAPGREYIEFLDDSVGYALPIRDAEHLMAETPQTALLYIRLLEEKAQQGKQREEMLRIPTATDRYRYLKDTIPVVVRQATQEMVASFLHLSPKHLSRLRREEAKGGKGKG
jgi:CRP-like cAMP-binding protein